MPSAFDTLSQAQKDAFNSRVKMLGFDPGSLADSDIVTGGGGCHIHGAVPEYAKNVKYKTVSSIDEAKKLLGVPDESFKRGTSDDHLKYPPLPAYAGKPDLTLSALTHEEETDLEDAAHAYLFGHSGKVAGWADTINRLLLPRELSLVAAQSVTVTPGNPLYIRDPSYTFGVVTIEPGGQIIVQADSSVNVQLLVKKS